MPDHVLDEARGYLAHIVDDHQNVLGTAFQIRPGVVISALHVVASLALEASQRGVRVLPLGADEPMTAVLTAAAGDLDLVVLQCAQPLPRSTSGITAS